MVDNLTPQSDYGSDDPLWIDIAWLDTVVVIGLTCFILCLMNLSKVCLLLLERRRRLDCLRHFF
jgi:hypothetical protein